jgi:hypothetical protein
MTVRGTPLVPTMRRVMLMLLLCAPPAFQCAANEVAIAGYGTLPCLQFNVAVKRGAGWADNAITQGVMSWAQGFMSGVNLLKLQDEHKLFDLGAVSIEEQWAYLVTYCRNNPADEVGLAVDDLIMRMLPEKYCPACGPKRTFPSKERPKSYE